MSASEPIRFCDRATESVLGVQALLDRLQPLSKAGRRRILELPTYRATDRQAWRRELDELLATESWCEARPDSEQAVAEALSQTPLLERPIRKLRADSPLEDTELFAVKRFLFHAGEAVGAALDLLGGWGLDEDAPEKLTDLMQAIHPQDRPTPRFYLSAELSGELGESRSALGEARERDRRLREAIEADIEAAFGGTFDIHGIYRPPDELSEDMLDADQRLQKTPNGWRLSDEDIVATEGRIERLERDVERLEGELRARLSERLADEVEWLEHLADLLTLLDVRLAKVALRRELDGCWPTWRDEPGIAISGGREPGIVALLDERPDETIQPIDVELGERAAVVTGPNMGGKSVLLRLVGICQWCAQHALPVPADDCRFAPVGAVVYVGSEEPEIATAPEGLSSFGREVRRLVDWWDAGVAPRLWLFDEVGRGTHPDEGADIACRVVQRLADRGDRVLAATHFPALASLSDTAKLRIAGLTDPDRLEELLGDPTCDVEAALRRVMDYQPVAVDRHDVPRDARVVARALGLDID